MFVLSDECRQFVKSELSRYETKRSAILPCLYKVQEENKGWISPEAITSLAKVMELPESWIQEVVDFYTMFNSQPVGRWHVQVCGNISCSMRGGRDIHKHLCKVFSGKGEDVSVSRVECLGACDGAPMMQVNDKEYMCLTPKKAEESVRNLMSGASDGN